MPTSPEWFRQETQQMKQRKQRRTAGTLGSPQSRTIHIDAAVWTELKRLAAEYEMQFAAPNDVLRRALCLPPRESGKYGR